MTAPQVTDGILHGYSLHVIALYDFVAKPLNGHPRPASRCRPVDLAPLTAFEPEKGIEDLISELLMSRS